MTQRETQLREALQALETAATVVVSSLPDGEYAGLGTLRMALRDSRAALATPETPTATHYPDFVDEDDTEG